MRYTIKDDRIIRQENFSGAIWPSQVQANTSFLCAERQQEFAWFVSQHAFYRQIGLDAGDIVKRRKTETSPGLKPVAKGPVAAKAATVAAQATKASSLSQNPSTLRRSEWPGRDVFLALEPSAVQGRDLRGGVRLPPAANEMFGYAWDKSRPSEKAVVIVFHNETPVLLTLADKENRRWDNDKLVISNNRNGFGLAIPPEAKDGDRIDAYFYRYKKQLAGFPLVIRDGKLEPADRPLLPAEPMSSSSERPAVEGGASWSSSLLKLFGQRQT